MPMRNRAKAFCPVAFTFDFFHTIIAYDFDFPSFPLLSTTLKGLKRNVYCKGIRFI